MGMPAQKGSGLGSIEVRAAGVTLRTALRQEIEIGRDDITRVEVKRARQPRWWGTNFYFVGDDGKRARHYFAAFRTSALRSALNGLGYAVVDV